MGLDLVRGGPTSRGGSLLRMGAIKRSELINFCFHMEQLVGAGVPLVESLIDLRDSIENARFREVIPAFSKASRAGSACRSLLRNIRRFSIRSLRVWYAPGKRPESSPKC